MFNRTESKLVFDGAECEFIFNGTESKLQFNQLQQINNEFQFTGQR